MRKLIAFLVLTLGMLHGQECEGEGALCRGKIDIAPAYVHVDFLQSGKTINKMDLMAVRADSYYRVWKGLLIKPNILYGHGKHDHEVLTGGIMVGFCIPLNKKLLFTPLVGYGWGYTRTSFDQDLPPNPLNLTELHIKNRFRSQSPIVGFELTWTFIPKWRVSFGYQYAWSRTHSKITGLNPLEPKASLTDRSKSEGSAISGLLEHDLNDHWSVNAGAAYNNSLSKEKHGVRGWGVKLGIAYWF